MQRFTAACAQFAITPMDAAANAAKAVAWTRRAVDETGAQLVVLPETVTTGFVPDVGPDGLWDIVDALPGRFSEPLQAGCAGSWASTWSSPPTSAALSGASSTTRPR